MTSKNKKHLKNTTKQSLKTLIWLVLFISVIGIYKTHNLLKPAEAQAPYARENNTFPIAEDRATSTMTVAERIIIEAQKANFKWPEYLLKLAKCESGLREFAKNTTGNKPHTSTDRGVFMINDYWHREVPDSVAYNVEEATKWTMRMIENGRQSAWVCDRHVRNNPDKYAVN